MTEVISFDVLTGRVLFNIGLSWTLIESDFINEVSDF